MAGALPSWRCQDPRPDRGLDVVKDVVHNAKVILPVEPQRTDEARLRVRTQRYSYSKRGSLCVDSEIADYRSAPSQFR